MAHGHDQQLAGIIDRVQRKRASTADRLISPRKSRLSHCRRKGERRTLRPRARAYRIDSIADCGHWGRPRVDVGAWFLGISGSRQPIDLAIKYMISILITMRKNE